LFAGLTCSTGRTKHQEHHDEKQGGRQLGHMAQWIASEADCFAKHKNRRLNSPYRAKSATGISAELDEEVISAMGRKVAAPHGWIIERNLDGY
jgi:hypothetical protein